ncbi:MAG: PAS domain-containing protein [Spirochaetia bacterium]|nr:PAS domain-containing protein [Spirochaetia bacterium]
MKKRGLIAAIILMCSVFVPAVMAVNASVNVNWNVSLETEGYYTAVREYCRVQDSDIAEVRRYTIPDEQMPIVFFMASKAGVEPIRVIKMRNRGFSWQKIAKKLGLGPDVFYVAVHGRVNHEIFGPLYLKYDRPRNDWRHIVLTDDDIYNWVNLRFICEHYGYTPERVIGMRGPKIGYIHINDNIRHEHWKKQFPGRAYYGGYMEYRDGQYRGDVREVEKRHKDAPQMDKRYGYNGKNGNEGWNREGKEKGGNPENNKPDDKDNNGNHNGWEKGKGNPHGN